MITHPIRRGRRPTAYEVTFGTEPSDSAPSDSSSRKRDRGGDGSNDLRNAKRRNLDSVPQPVRKYESPRGLNVLSETANLVVTGEEPDPPDDGRKRTRSLFRFILFDANRDNEIVSPDVLDEGRHHILAAGLCVAKYEVDEDAGQEDDFDQIDPEYIRLSPILRYFTRYWEMNSPFFVETNHAIYELAMPSKKYRSQYRSFWRLQTILRFVLSSVTTNRDQTYNEFMQEYNTVSVSGYDESLTERELWDAVPKLRKILETVPRADELRKTEVMKILLSGKRPESAMFKPVAIERAQERSSTHILRVQYKGNLDDAVLRPEMRIPTHVTQRIAQMAVPLFREVLRVIARPPKEESNALDTKEDLANRLAGFLRRTQSRRRTQFRPDQRIGRSRWLKHILIDDVKYEIGDTILFYPLPNLPNPDTLSPTDTLADHFWFARIIQINGDHETVHVQWFEHSSKTFLQELGHAQELFLTDNCDSQKIKHIIGKVTTHYIEPDQSLADVRPHDFYYRYLWDSEEGTFTNVNIDAMTASARQPPPDNCHVCDVTKKFDQGLQAEKIHLGWRWHGVDYHLDDCVFIKADEGPCHIGQICRFIHSREGHDVQVVVQLFGRTDKVGCRPDTTLKDERHLFFTDDEMTTPIKDLIGVCFVVVKREMPDLDAWLEMSSNRFYVKYRFPSLSIESWGDKRRMNWNDLSVCPICMKEDRKKFKGMKAFLEAEPPLRTFDPFGGAGAFGLAMEEVGCFKMTHAVEIAPSAAETLRNNASAGIKVYNQCSNSVLWDAILTHKNVEHDTLKSVKDHALPPPLKPGDIDCLVAGFPCQPHSSLNMYQSANDGKSSLILTTLSYVDFLRPSYCIFENVRGFLYYRLRARQASKYAVKGGIPMGGLKLVAAALLDMGYQLRCGLLEAAHYGTPQHRVRFFLIAAKRGLELPPFPQPTHDTPDPEKLDIKFPEEHVFQPIISVPGIAPHRYVCVDDAIGDLPKFEWKDPKEVLSERQMRTKRLKECLEKEPWCGFDGPNIAYEHEPRTTFQQKCRRRPTRDIQHYSRTFPPEKVNRIINIPVRPGADYRSLRPEHLEWQNANPASAAARDGHRGGYYGRVRGDGLFQTTVTNVDPMAKQSKVIHPYSKRIVTVRELARSQGFPDHFVFHAANKRVKTMLRQIGNAVPWPVSVAIAREFRDTLYKDWVKRNPRPEEPELEFTDDGSRSMDEAGR